MYCIFLVQPRRGTKSCLKLIFLLSFICLPTTAEWTNFTQKKSEPNGNIEQPANLISDLDIQYPNLTAPFIKKLFQSAMANSTAANRNCGKNKIFDAAEQMCCTLCPKGEGVVVPCANRHGVKYDTECEICAEKRDEHGNTIAFLDVVDHSTPCRTCATCPKHAHETHKCNGTHNTKCECDTGFYSARMGSDEESKPVCVACKTCPKGTKVARGCSHTGDKLCEECPKGTFSDKQNAEKCQTCTLCPYGVKMSRNCSKTEDRKCAVSISSGIQLNSPSSRDVSEPSHTSPGTNLIPVYCAIFGAIIVSLVIYVCIKRWKLCPGDRKKPGQKNSIKKQPSTNNNHNSGLLPLYSAQPAKNMGNQHLIPLNYQQPIRISSLAMKSPKQSQGSNFSNFSVSTAAESQKLLPQHGGSVLSGQKLSSFTLDELERQLTSRSTGGEAWVALAKKLGYCDTVSVRQESAAMAITPTRRLLQKWNEDVNCDISSFKRALAESGHSELCVILDNHVAVSRSDMRTSRQLIL